MIFGEESAGVGGVLLGGGMVGGDVDGNSRNEWAGGAVSGQSRGGRIDAAASWKREHCFMK